MSHHEAQSLSLSFIGISHPLSFFTSRAAHLASTASLFLFSYEADVGGRLGSGMRRRGDKQAECTSESGCNPPQSGKDGDAEWQTRYIESGMTIRANSMARYHTKGWRQAGPVASRTASRSKSGCMSACSRVLWQPFSSQPLRYPCQ